MSTYYVSAASGSNGNAGTSEGAAWATIDKAMNTAVAGDKVWVKTDGNYNETATIDTAATAITPIIFEGYTSSTGDNGQAIINGQSTRVNCVDTTLGGSIGVFYVFKNFRFTGATSDGIAITTIQNFTFKNCKFDTNGNNGISIRGAIFEKCEFSSNTSMGCNVSSLPSAFIGCKFYSNGTYGLSTGDNTVVLYSEFFSNGSDNMSIGSADVITVVAGCTIDGDNKDSNTGITLNSAANLCVIVNNVIYDCVTGLSSSAGNRGERVISRNNLVNANTTAYVDSETFTGEITSAPQFVNEVGGADYTPAIGSPLINAGLNGG